MSEKTYTIPTVKPVVNHDSVRGAAVTLRDYGKPITATTVAAVLDADVAECQAVLDGLEAAGAVQDAAGATVAEKPVMARVAEALAAKVAEPVEDTK